MKGITLETALLLWLVMLILALCVLLSYFLKHKISNSSKAKKSKDLFSGPLVTKFFASENKLVRYAYRTAPNDAIEYIEYDQLLCTDENKILENAWAAIKGGWRIVVWREINKNVAGRVLSISIYNPDGTTKKIAQDEMHKNLAWVDLAEKVLNLGKESFDGVLVKLDRGQELN